MLAVRPWYVIPALGLAGAGAGFAATHAVVIACTVGLTSAALAAAIRAFLGPSAVAAVAAAAGAALGTVGMLVLAPHAVPRAALAGAAGLFALAELVRAKQPHESPLPAAGAALLAGVLDPSYVGLIAVSGVAWLVAPISRPRGLIALPLAGIAATALAIAAACAAPQGSGGPLAGPLAGLWHAWLGHPTHPRELVATVVRAGDLVGPLATCAALLGLGACLAHGRYAAAGLGLVVAVTAVASLGGGFVAPATPLVAALGAGVAVGRLAALVRLPVGQAFVGATAGFVLVAVPVWTLLAAA